MIDRYSSFASLILALFTLASRAQLQDVCDGTGVRPVLAIHAFRSGPLFDASANYTSVFLDVNPDGTPAGVSTNLQLPLEFEGLVQANSSVGPEAFEGDEFPVLGSTPWGQTVESGVFGDVKDLVESWEHPTDAELPMFYTMAWDWRRDLWEQAERVLRHSTMVHNVTACRPMIVAHSNGGRLTYVALARYGEQLTAHVAGVLYAVPQFLPLSGFTPGVPDQDIGQSRDFGNPTPPEVTASWTSIYGTIPAANQTCLSASSLLATDTTPCTAPESVAVDAGANSLRTGVVCNSTACGRPSDFPANETFYLPIDLRDPTEYEAAGVGLSAVRELTAEERTFLTGALGTAARLAPFFRPGPERDAVQAIHPPGLVLSIALDSIPAPRSIECEPNPATFNDTAPLPAGTARCLSIQPWGFEPGDGVYPATAHQPPGAGWPGIIDVRTLTEVPEPLAGLVASGARPDFSVHAAIFRFRAGNETTLDCSKVPDPDPPDRFPLLEEALCGVVRRIDAAATSAAGGSGGMASDSVGGILTIASAVIAVLAGPLLAIWIVRRRRNGAHKGSAAGAAAGAKHGSKDSGSAWRANPLGREAARAPSHYGPDSMRVDTDSVTGTPDERRQRLRDGELAASSPEVAAVEEALDAMRAQQQLFMGLYEVLGATERRAGGQGVVQFATDSRSQTPVVLKFFLDAEAYAAEVALFDNAALAAVMPHCFARYDNADGSLVSPNGYAFPPVLVMQRGESLHEFMFRSDADVSTTVQALTHIVQRVEVLHAAGFVHRDLKPSNILRMPEEHAWALIDFGCAAAEGAEATVGFTPAYAPPEVAAAYAAGATSMTAAKSADVWSIGVIAYELLTGEQVFPHGATPLQICDALLGKAPLRWEAVEQAELQRLMRLRGVVLQCLSRNAAQRPAVSDLIDAMNALFDEVTTTMTQRSRA